MKVLDAKLNWYWGYSNPVGLQVLVDKMPDHKDLKYRAFDEDRVNNTGFYFAESGGYVNFFAATTDRSGYAGRTFNITLENGESRSFKGPWSSNYMYTTERTGVKCFEASITDNLESFNRGYTFYAGCITWPLVLDACKKLVDKQDFGLGDLAIKNKSHPNDKWLCVPISYDRHKFPMYSFAVGRNGAWLTKINTGQSYIIDPKDRDEIHWHAYPQYKPN